EILSFYEGLRESFAAIPGVRSATLSHASLLAAGRRLELRLSGTLLNDTWILHTGPDFFSTMQIPMRMGRQIEARDQNGSAGVVVVNEEFVRTHSSGQNPLGQRLTLGGRHPREMEIVGVSANAHYGRLKDELKPVAFIPYNQGDNPRVQQMVFTLRTAGDPLAYTNSVREIVHRADSRIPVINVTTQKAQIDLTMNQEIVFARLCS